MKTHGFGIIGLEMISDIHANAIINIEGAKLIAGFDSDSQRATDFSAKYNCKGYDNLKEFLSNPDIEIVTVATPTGMHLDAVVAAAKAKKHVIVEKPMEINPQRCNEIIEVCKANNVVLSGVFPYRYHKPERLVKKAIEEGRFGKIAFADAQVKWYRSQQYYDSSSWRGTWNMDGGGCLMNQGIHAVDALQWLMGPVEEVFAFSNTIGHERIEVEDTAAVTLKFKNGAVGTIEGTTCAYPGFFKKIEVMGTKGSAIIEEESIIEWKFQEETDEDEKIRQTYANATASGGGASDPASISFVYHQNLFEAFLNNFENGKEPEITGESASKAVQIIYAAYESAKTGRPVKL